MSIINRIADAFGYERKGLTYADIWLRGDPIPDSMMGVSPESALRVAAVMACVRVLSETVASLPLIIYRRLPNGGKERATDHPLYNILHDQPNSWQTSFEWREMLQSHLALRGNAYNEIVWDSRAVKQIVPLNPARMQIDVADDHSMVYLYQEKTGGRRPIPASDILHIRGLSSDGVIGLSPIALADKTIKLAMSAERYGASVFDSGGTKRLALKYPGQLSPDAKTRLAQSMDRTYAGKASTIVLEDGLDATAIGMTNEDAQFLDVRKFQINEIARLYRVPPHMIGDLERATFSNIEHQAIEFVVHTIRPWLVRWEQAITRDIIVESERKTYFVEFLVDGLLRGDSISRTMALKNQFMNGAINLDEWRAIENRNPLPDGDGQVHYVPVNLAPVGTEPDVANEPEPEPKAVANVDYGPFVRDIANRIAVREIREIKSHVDMDKDKFDVWIIDFFDKHCEYVSKCIRPLLDMVDGDSKIADAKCEMISIAIINRSVLLWKNGDSLLQLGIWDKSRAELLFCYIMSECASEAFDSIRYKIKYEKIVEAGKQTSVDSGDVFLSIKQTSVDS